MLTHRFDDALRFAVQAHRDQTRKGTDTPYISHLMAVSSLVLEYGGDEDQAIAALLHDAVEDQGGMTMADQIRDRFGERVVRIVLECSDSSDGQKDPWQARKDAYIASIESKSADATLVTACDKLHNASAILNDLKRDGPSVFDRFTARRDGTLWYYGELSRALGARMPGSLSNRLAETVHALIDVAAIDGSAHSPSASG